MLDMHFKIFVKYAKCVKKNKILAIFEWSLKNIKFSFATHNLKKNYWIYIRSDKCIINPFKSTLIEILIFFLIIVCFKTLRIVYDTGFYQELTTVWPISIMLITSVVDIPSENTYGTCTFWSRLIVSEKTPRRQLF